MVADVSKERLAETVTALCSIPTRYSPTSGGRLAGTSIYNYFSRLGLAVEYDQFKYDSPRVAGAAAGRNVVATLTGTGVPERIVVVGAHYDSFSTSEFRLAPGADDNASGVAAVLEIARVLSRHPGGLTIRFIAFDAEEQGLFGSEHAAARARARRESIVAMLNLDMVGVSDGGRRALALVPDRDGEWVADRFMDAAKRYGIVINLVKRVYAKWARSDQASFWAAGFPALGISENEPDDTRQYHHVGDTPETLDLDFLTAVTRATLAAVAELARQPAAGQTGK
jgi:Zn-dependent M28 family amino/carboxypeptidase